MEHHTPKSSSLGADAVQLTLSKVLSLAVTMLTTALLSYFIRFMNRGVKLCQKNTCFS